VYRTSIIGPSRLVKSGQLGRTRPIHSKGGRKGSTRCIGDNSYNSEIYIASLNVRTFKDSKFDVFGLSEVRRKNEEMKITIEGNMFCHIGNYEGQRGVGLLIKKEWVQNIRKFKEIPDGLALIKVEVGNNVIKIVQVYSPTTESEEEAIEDFYIKLGDVLHEQSANSKKSVIIVGDFNSQIGMGKIEAKDVVGQYCYGRRNYRRKVNRILCRKRID